jgi:hypothetical protein
MNWALGFRQLGWEVHLVECLKESELEPCGGGSIQEKFWAETCSEFDFVGRESLLVETEDGRPAVGGDYSESRRQAWEHFAEVAQKVDLFLNYSGQFKRLELLGPQLKKVYLDVDPAFTQLWAEVSGCDMNLVGHDVFWTIGRGIGSSEALLPLAGIDWTPTLPVVAAEAWERIFEESQTHPAKPEAMAPWTTVGHWYGYGAMPWNGRSYSGKRESFLQLVDLPGKTKVPLVLATDLQRDWGDLNEFEAAGWRFVSSAEVCATVPSYLQFLRGSRGELGVAKGGYVTSRCGWVSDRSLVYLSLGRPVLLQETGWTKWIEPQPGLRAFSTLDEAAENLAQMEENYATEAAGAAEIARNYFSPEKILSPLLNRL